MKKFILILSVSMCTITCNNSDDNGNGENINPPEIVISDWDSFKKSLKTEKKDWLDKNTNKENIVKSYLEDVGYSKDETNFSKEAISVTMEVFPSKSVEEESEKNVKGETPNKRESFVFKLLGLSNMLTHLSNSSNAITVANNALNTGGPESVDSYGKSDALRHVYWCAIDTKDLGERITKLFTDSHEYESSGLYKEMDLFNNSVGIELGKQLKTSTKEEIRLAAIRAIHGGKAKYIKNGQLVNTNQ